MGAPDPIVGYSDFVQEGERVFATAHRESGAVERGEVRISVDREIRRDGEVIASGEVASSVAGTVTV